MKVDKSNPKHYIIFAVSVSFLILALPFRLLPRRQTRPTVVLFGHKLNGNLIPLYEKGLEKSSPIDFYYLTLDPDYYADLREQKNILFGLNLFHVIRLVRSDVFITDHSAYHYILLHKITNMKFVDVWHGIPYKGFGYESFKTHDYNEVWVSSEKLREMYIDKFGFEKNQVYAIGYARVERLINLRGQEKQIRKKYGLEDKRTVLIAPTWQQDDAGRSIIPFGLSLKEFVQSIADGNEDAQIIFRAHLNVKDKHEIVGVSSNIKIMSYGDYPVGEDFLAISDVVISDWSSIVFDFMPLNRPVIFLDVPPPFKRGFSLGPEYRFGAVVKDGNSLNKAVHDALNNPKEFQRKYAKAIKMTDDVAYGSTLDGHVIDRSMKRLQNLSLK